MISLLVFAIIFGILIIVHEFGHFILAKREGVKVQRFSLGFGPQLFKKKKNGTEYSISLIPLGGYVKLAGDNLEEYQGRKDEYFSKTILQRARIIFFGPLLNYILGFFCFWLIFFAGYPTLTTRVGGLLDGFGAKEAGLKAGDKIISVDGRRLDTWDDLQMFIYSKDPSSTVKLSFLRGNQEFSLDVKLKKQELNDQLGTKRNVGLLGITPELSETIKVRHNFWDAFILSIDKTASLTAITYKAIWRLISGGLTLGESVTGPIGIFYITSKAASLGVSAVLNLIGLLSISLAIFNLLPLPVLDGGHLLLLLIEKIRGKYLNVKVERIITQAGFMLIIALALVVTYNDILRFFGDKLPKLLK